MLCKPNPHVGQGTMILTCRAEWSPRNMLRNRFVPGATSRASSLRSPSAATDEVGQRRHGWLSRNVEAAAEMTPKGDAQLRAGFGQAEEGIATVASNFVAGATAGLWLGYEYVHVKPTASLTIDNRCIRFGRNWTAPDLQRGALREFNRGRKKREASQQRCTAASVGMPLT